MFQIVEAWQLGTQSGNAIAQVLYGDYNPSGKLPMTFPRSVEVPIYYNYKTQVVQKWLNLVMYFGHIILMKNDAFILWIWFSYSKFEYSNLELSQKSFANNESISFCNIKKHW
jgi:beta-glucosidase